MYNPDVCGATKLRITGTFTVYLEENTTAINSELQARKEAKEQSSKEIYKLPKSLCFVKMPLLLCSLASWREKVAARRLYSKRHPAGNQWD